MGQVQDREAEGGSSLPGQQEKTELPVLSVADSNPRVRRSIKTQVMEGRYWLMFLTALWLSMELGTASKEGTWADRPCCTASPSAQPPKSCGSCGPGQCCEDKQCSRCKLLSQCLEGKELYCTGTIEYQYFCKGCPDGTYSETNHSCCKPWTDCKQIGLWTVQLGNKTHNVVCGLKPSPIVVEPVSPDNLSYWIPVGGFVIFLIIMIAASVLILTVVIFCLITHIIIHREKPHGVEEPKSIHPLNLLGSQLDLEDTFSCQFPEEEHGDKKLAENF